MRSTVQGVSDGRRIALKYADRSVQLQRNWKTRPSLVPQRVDPAKIEEDERQRWSLLPNQSTLLRDLPPKISQGRHEKWQDIRLAQISIRILTLYFPSSQRKAILRQHLLHIFLRHRIGQSWKAHLKWSRPVIGISFAQTRCHKIRKIEDDAEGRSLQIRHFSPRGKNEDSFGR